MVITIDKGVILSQHKPFPKESALNMSDFDFKRWKRKLDISLLHPAIPQSEFLRMSIEEAELFVQSPPQKYYEVNWQFSGFRAPFTLTHVRSVT
jgi:hypothetical protein